MTDLQRYHDIGRAFVDELKLTTYPVAVRLIRAEEEEPQGALRAAAVFGSEIPACLAYTHCRRSGISLCLTAGDIACKPIVLYFGLEALADPDDLYRAWAEHAGYKRDMERERESREADARLEPFEFKGLVVSPLDRTVVEPDLAMIYCSPLVLSHLVLAATYDGESIVSHFNGMESSCKEGIIRTFQTGECQVVVPGMGDRVMSAVQDHEMIFAIPAGRLEAVRGNLFRAGDRISSPSPFSIPHATPTLGSGRIFGNPVEPRVWPTLREKLAGKPGGDS
jgi:uncharacterized protein (DUF169 family)